MRRPPAALPWRLQMPISFIMMTLHVEIVDGRDRVAVTGRFRYSSLEHLPVASVALLWRLFMNALPASPALLDMTETLATQRVSVVYGSPCAHAYTSPFIQSAVDPLPVCASCLPAGRSRTFPLPIPTPSIPHNRQTMILPCARPSSSSPLLDSRSPLLSFSLPLCSMLEAHGLDASELRREVRARNTPVFLIDNKYIDTKARSPQNSSFIELCNIAFKRPISANASSGDGGISHPFPQACAVSAGGTW